MTCTRCQRFDAAPDGVLCRSCEASDAHPAAPSPGEVPGTALPVRTPHGSAWLRSPVGLGRAVAILLGVVIAIGLFAVWADLVMLDVLGRVAEGEFGPAVERDADRADRLNAAATFALGAALIATMVVFLVWFHRVRVNAEVFEPFGHRKKRGWAIGGWLVPVVNLWFPRRIAIDCWDASSPWEKPRSHALVNSWWTLWVIYLLADRSSSVASRKAETVEEIRSAYEQVLFVDAFRIPTAVLAFLFVLALTRMQNDKARSGRRAPEPVSV